VTLLLSALFGLASVNSGCCPRLVPPSGQGYDVLKPNEAVKLNPLGFTPEGNLIVNPEFAAWVLELEQEIVKLRKYIKGK
jgi:hypothetical protein